MNGARENKLRARISLCNERHRFSTKKEYPILEKEINSSTVIDVAPLGIHQLESTSDIFLLEASTNHLDDVIRLKDDTGRGDGKIESEHKLN